MAANVAPKPVLGIIGASISAAAFSIVSPPYTAEGAANFRANSLARGYDIPWRSAAVGGSTMTAVDGQIAILEAALGGSPEGWHLHGHSWGNDASNRGNYPANWDGTELSTYNNLCDNTIASVVASSASVKLLADLSYRFNVTGSQQINEDIIRPKIAAALAVPYVPWFVASKASSDLGQYFADTNLHPSDTGVLVLHDATLDSYISATGIAQTDIEDQFVISFGDAAQSIPNVRRMTAVGTQTITTQRKVTGGTCTIAGGTGFGAGTGATGTSYQFDSTHRDFFPTTFYGSFASFTATVAMPAWANRAVRVQVTGVRATTGRETDFTINGETLRIDPNNVTLPRTVTFLTTMDGSGNLVLTGTPVNQYAYLTAMSIDLLRLPEPSSIVAGIVRSVSRSVVSNIVSQIAH